MSLSLAGGASAAAIPPADTSPREAISGHELLLHEEEVADVGLATFYIFDKELSAQPQVQSACEGAGLSEWPQQIGRETSTYGRSATLP